MKILLLDIDGVLNSHNTHPNGYNRLDHAKLALLHEIITSTDCKIVLVSAWRYMILGKSMDMRGFQYLMLTHGASREVCDAIIGLTPEDVNPNDPHDRAKLAVAYLKEITHDRVVALDDLDLGYTALGIPFVQTDPKVGLTAKCAARTIAILS
jgi:hypothetical protein